MKLADNITLYTKDTTDTSRRLLDLINSLSKIEDTNQHTKISYHL